MVRIPMVGSPGKHLCRRLVFAGIGGVLLIVLWLMPFVLYPRVSLASFMIEDSQGAIAQSLPQSIAQSGNESLVSPQPVATLGLKAPITVDGRVLFEVGSITSFSATQRADIANAELERTLENTPPEVPILLNVNTQGDLTTIWIDDRLLLTMTEGDFMLGEDPVAQAEAWVDLLNPAIARAQNERTPAYQRQAAITCAGLLALAIALHLAVRWLYRKLRRQIAHRADDKTCWVSHWSVRGILKPVLSYARLAVWLGAGFYFTGLFHWSRYWRYRIVQFLQNTFASQVFVLGEQKYSILDFGRAGILIIMLWVIVRAVTTLLRSRLLRNVGASREVQDAIALTVQLLLTGTGLIVILSGLGFDIASLAIFASVLGVGIGFGLQNIANNFMSGLIILFERPIRAGDFVRVGELTGTVERIGARSTEIRTLDLVTIIVPNSELIQTKVVNWSHGHPVSRLHIPFGVAYGTDIKTMRAVVLEAVQLHPEVLRYPQPQIRFHELGDSSLNFDVLVWIRDPRQQFRIRSDLYYLLEANFRRYDIEIPFPQQDLHVHWPDSGTPPVIKAGGSRLQHAQPLMPSPEDPTPSPYQEGDQSIETPQLSNSSSKIQNPKPVLSLPNASKIQSPAALLSDLLDSSILVRQAGDLSDDELQALVEQMRRDGGVNISDRRYGLQVYDRCFIGSEAVTWLAKNQKATRDEAIRIGQQLIERGLMHHVTDEHTFEDQYLFYRFYTDEQRTMNYE